MTENKTPKVSIIMPIYNAGTYLSSCLDSLINQTLKDIEIICILDCPTDGSDKIVEQYAQQDNRIKIIKNQHNLHIGESRNQGLSMAQGEYIGFCDHDDFCEANMFEDLYAAITKTDADVCVSYQYEVFDNKQITYKVPEAFDDDSAIRTIISAAPQNATSADYSNVRSVWTHLYKTEFLRNHQLVFVDNKLFCNEDTMFCVEVYLCNPKVAVLPKTVYQWRQHRESTVHSYSYVKISNVVHYVERIHNLLQEKTLYDRYFDSFATCLIRKLYTSFWSEFNNGKKAGYINYKQQILQSPILCKAILEISNSKSRLTFVPITKRLFFYFILSHIVKSKHKVS